MLSTLSRRDPIQQPLQFNVAAHPAHRPKRFLDSTFCSPSSMHTSHQLELTWHIISQDSISGMSSRWDFLFFLSFLILFSLQKRGGKGNDLNIHKIEKIVVNCISSSSISGSCSTGVSWCVAVHEVPTYRVVCVVPAVHQMSTPLLRRLFVWYPVPMI